MVTSHGGNSAAMTLVAQDLRAQHGLLAVTTGWSRFGAPEGLFSAEELRHGIHGGAVETSIMLARYPQHVRKRQRSPISARAASRWRRIIAGSRRIGRRRSPGRPRTFIPAAPPAMPTLASAEKGERLLDHGARAFCELLADVDKFDVKRLLDGPDHDPLSNCFNLLNIQYAGRPARRIRTGFESLRPTGHADHNGPALNRMEFLMSIKTKIAALALAALAVTGSIASTTTKAEAHGLGLGAGASEPASSAPPSSAARSPPATTATITTAIAAAAGFASSTPTATTSAASAPATTD